MKMKIRGIPALLLLLAVWLCAGLLAQAEPAMVVPMLKAGGGTDGAKSYQYTVKSGEVLNVPVTVPKAGEVCLDVSVSMGAKEMGLTFSGGSDPADAARWINARTVQGDVKNDSFHTYVKKAGTYYFSASLASGASEETAQLTVKAYELPATAGNAGTLAKGKWTAANGVLYMPEGGMIKGETGESQPAYFKVKIPSDGCMKLEIKGEAAQSGQFTLLNSKKKKLGNEGSGQVSYYGVKKGVYYIKADTVKSYKIRYTFEGIKDKKNTSRKSAVALSAKRTEKGVFTVGSKKSRWYKLKLKKAQTLKLTVTANKAEKYGYCVFSLSDSKGKSIGWGKLKGLKKKQVKKKLKAGTYYLELSPGCGSYSVRWD